MRALATHAAWIMQMWTKTRMTADRLVGRRRDTKSFDSIDEIKQFAAAKREG